MAESLPIKRGDDLQDTLLSIMGLARSVAGVALATQMVGPFVLAMWLTGLGPGIGKTERAYGLDATTSQRRNGRSGRVPAS